MAEKHVMSCLDIPVFTWEEWDEVDTAYLQFYNVEFLLDDLKKYNKEGLVVSVNMNWDITIYEEDNVIELNLRDSVSFKEALIKG